MWSQSRVEEYGAVLERQNYKRKAGEEITQQMYSFVDKDGNGSDAETGDDAELARMVLSERR